VERVERRQTYVVHLPDSGPEANILRPLAKHAVGEGKLKVEEK